MPSVAHIIRRRRNRKHRRQHTKRSQRLWIGLLVGSMAAGILIPIVIILGLAGMLYFQAVDYLPTPADTIFLDPIIGATELYDRSGATIIYSVQDPLGNNRQWMDIETLPPYLLDATLIMQDADYLDAGGFNFNRTITRLWRYILGQGNTTDRSIAGLLADNVLVPPALESGLDEELLHIALTAEVNRRYTPRRVLEWYLNTAYYGNDAYGIDAAAQVYFAKSASELTLDEAAMLAAIPPVPQFNPLDNETPARGRQLELLRALLTNDRITRSQFQEAAATETVVRTDLAQVPYVAPDFSLYAREQTEEILNRMGLDGARLVSRGGLSITTTLDTDLYYQAECTVRAHLAQLGGASKSAVTTQHNQPCIGAAYLRDVFDIDATALPDNGVLLIQDAQTGEIFAMVGDASTNQYEPGFVLQPFVYLTGFLSGNFNAGKMLLDIPQPFPGVEEGLIYTPINPDGVYRGPINLRDAMVAGLRAAATEVADREGMSNVLSIARRMGIMGLDDVNIFDLSLIERGGDVSVLDMVYAYSVFATLGNRQGVDADNARARNPVAVLRIEDSAGNVLWEYDNQRISLSRTPVLEPEVAYIVNSILSDSSTRRNVLAIDDTALTVGRPVALVNGLTRDKSDSWTIGYTPQLVVGVHLGRVDGTSLSLDVHGLNGAAAIWQAMTRFAHERYDYQAAGWARPDDIVDYIICERSGLIRPTSSNCPARTEIYLRGATPTQEDSHWRTVQINSQTRQLASSSTPAYLVIEEVYFEPPNAALDWWVSNNQPLPPTNYDTITRPETFSDVQILQPIDFSYVGGEVDVRGALNTDDMTAWRLRFGEGLNPTQWLDISTPQSEFVEGRSMGIWDTVGLDGLYTLELSVDYADGQRETAAVHITVDNVNPTIALATADNSTTYRFPAQTSATLVATVSDNLTAINRVEFYHEGVLVFIDSEAPYRYDFPLDAVGIESFSAAVFDQVGNQAEAQLDIEVSRGS